MHKTKWAKGWLPIETYKKSVDELVTVGLKYDWESLREDIIANKGIRNSSLISHMPAESSSKASGATNSVYPIRDTALKKTDAYNAIDWCAIDGDIYGDQYQSAWVIDSVDMLKGYAVLQKFADQAISADLYRDRTVNLNITTDEIINTFLTMVKYGVKTRYYQNSLTLKEKTDNDVGIPTITEDEEEIDLNSEERGCAGSCTL
jgi:ribonucleoside-diphosphate reductase alpha chain